MRIPTKFIICAFCTILFFSFSLLKYNGSVEEIIAQLEAYATSHSPSKIYIQTDRSTYALEDTVWFKTYTLDATYNVPTAIGKVIYVDIVDSKGDKVLGKKLYSESLGASSDFFIGREWMPGRYKLRAYTKFMLNYDQEYIYNKEIQIVDINKATDESYTSSDVVSVEGNASILSSLDLSFFPEGGDLVAGIDSRVAVKIENSPDELADVSGVIEDISGNHVASFKIYNKGYGLAVFKPVPGKKYIAKLNNNPKLHPLPDVKVKGYNILLNSKSDFVSIVISSNIALGLSGGDVLVHSRGQLLFHKKLGDVVNNSYKIRLNKKEIYSGVTHVTFFDKDGIPRTERLFFVDNDLSESVITSDKEVYSRKEKVNLSLSVINNDLASFDCSVSVFEKSTLEGAGPSDNIKSWMLLNSDLRGEIKDPAYYFEESGNRQRGILLDLVMMTHGWRRFTWADMSQEEVFGKLEYDRELGLYVSGSTNRHLNKNKPIKSNVVLNFLSNGLYQEEVVTGDDGRFKFGPFVMEDSATAIIQARIFKEKTKKDFVDGNRALEINIDKPEDLVLKKRSIEEKIEFHYATYDEYINNNIAAQAIKDQSYEMEIMLSEVVLKAKRKTEKEKLAEYIAKSSYYGTPSNRVIIKEEDRISSLSVFDLLRRVPGVVVNGSSITIRGVSSIQLSSAPLFLLDGVPVDAEVVRQIRTEEIWLIDVLKGPDTAIFGARGANGVIAVYTGRPPNSNDTSREPGIVNLMIKGFDKHRQFYSPDYSKSASISDSDMRSTLYWNPYVILSKGKTNSLSFFTGDNTGNYVVVKEGLSESGALVFGMHEFTVE